MSTPREVADHFRQEAAICRRRGSPFMGSLLEAAAASIEGPGVAQDLVGHWPGSARADALAARLASALHAAVLSGRDQELTSCYPANGAAGDGGMAWTVAERFIARDRDWVSNWLKSPPQTNEVQRASGLFAALSLLAAESALPLELLELGASAGLNLSLDRFAYRNSAWRWGDSDVVIETDWQGKVPTAPGFEVASRAGCDQNPLDPSRADDRLRLLSYVWPDQFDRLQRLRNAMALAAAQGLLIERRDAGEWIEQQLARPRAGRLTVVYHSIFYHYPPQATRQRIDAAIRAAGERAAKSAPLAWLRFEFEAALGGPIESTRCLLDVISWPGGLRRTLAEVDSHGRFVRWN